MNEQPTLIDLADGETDTAATTRTDLPAVNVLCDKSGKLGALSYQVPDDLDVRPGDAVQVPFGKTTKVGIVLGDGDPERATRAILEVHGRRSTAADIAHAHAIADAHFVDVAKVASRLAPTSGKSDEPVDAGPLALSAAVDAPPDGWDDVDTDRTRRYLLRAPLVDAARIAAHEAARVAAATSGQVLILCPSVDLVGRVLACFASGARRLDTKANHGSWAGFVAGTVTVGVATRAGALYAAAQLGGIVVVEEDHPGHIEASQPYTHARDLAASRTYQAQANLTLVGTRPSAAALSAGMRVFALGDDTDWPKLTLLDRADYPPEQRQLPRPVIELARERVDAGGSVYVLAERLPAIRRCGRCSEVRSCAQCAAEDRAQSTCTHPSEPCTTCGETRTWVAGWDADRIAATFGRLDIDVTPITFPELAGARDLGTVICPDVDRALHRPGFDPDELAAPLLLAAMEATGPGGHVVAVTNEPSHPLLKELFADRDQVAGAKRAYEAAKAQGLPPFGHLITVTCGWQQRPDTSRWPGRVLGPSKVRGEWETLVLLPLGELDTFRTVAEHIRGKGKVRITVQ